MSITINVPQWFAIFMAVYFGIAAYQNAKLLLADIGKLVGAS